MRTLKFKSMTLLSPLLDNIPDEIWGGHEYKNIFIPVDDLVFKSVMSIVRIKFKSNNQIINSNIKYK